MHSPKHVRRSVGDIPALALPTDHDPTEPRDLIVATDGSVIFGVGITAGLLLHRTKISWWRLVDLTTALHIM
jgi:hypothetical protein